MSRFRFLHAADLHLDSPFRGMSGVPQPIRDTIRGSTFRSLERLVQLALEQRAQFVILAGDVYDLEDRSIRAQLRFHRAAEQLADAGIRVFIAHGNHDPLTGKRMVWEPPQGVHVFGADEAEMFAVHDEHGRTAAYVHGISFATAAVTDNLAARFRVRDRSAFNIAVLHTNVDASGDHDNYAPSSRAELSSSGMDYWALGHIHARSVLHERPHIVYPGNVQGRSIKETGAKGCYIVDVEEGKEVRLTFHATDSVRWLKTSVSVEDARTEWDVKEAIERALRSARETADGRPAVVRLAITGRSDMHRLLKNSTLLEELVAEWNEEESIHTEQDPAYRFVWVEGCKLHTADLLDRALLVEQESFVGDMLRIAAGLKQDEAALFALAEQMTGDMLRSKTGKYVRDGQAAHGSPGSVEREELAELLAGAEDWLLDMLVHGGKEG